MFYKYYLNNRLTVRISESNMKYESNSQNKEDAPHESTLPYGHLQISVDSWPLIG